MERNTPTMGKFVNKTAYVYNIIPNKNAFAISEDDEAIFIHASAVARDDLQLGQWYVLKCHENVPSTKTKPTDWKFHVWDKTQKVAQQSHTRL
jgi:hypothetical protein